MSSARVRPIDVLIRGVDQLSAQIVSVSQKLEKMQAPAERASRSVGFLGTQLKLPGVGESLGRVSHEFGRLMGFAQNLALGGGLFGGGVLFGIKKFIDYGDDIGTVSTRIGVNAKALQELRYAAEQLDLPQEQLDTGLQKFNRSLGDALAHDGPMRRFFGALKINLTAAGKQRPAIDVLEEVGDKVKKLSPALQTLAVGTFFGRGNSAFINLFSEDGSKGIERYRKEAESLGAVLSNDTVNSLGQADIELRRLKFASIGAASAIGVELLPDIRKAIVGMTDWLQANRGWLRDSVVPELRDFAHWVKEIAPRVLSAVQAVGGLKTVVMATAAIMIGPGVLALGQLALGVAGLAAEWITLNGVIAVGQALLNPWVLGLSVVGLTLVELYKHFAPFRNLVDWGWDKLKAFGSWASEKSDQLDQWGAKYSYDPNRPRGGPGAPYIGSPLLGSAAAAAPVGGRLFSGNIGVDLRLAQGLQASVGPMRASRGLDLDATAGPIMAGAL